MAVDALAPPVIPSTDPLGMGFDPLPQAPVQGDMFESARQQYPILQNQDLGYVTSPPDPHGRQLEAWFPGQKGWDWKGQWFQRPAGLPLDKYGVEVFQGSSAQPIDILGDVVSHFMIDRDPAIQQAYQTFQSSLTPEQIRRLREQYAWAQRHMGEDRPYEEWKRDSGLPAYFRGYLFKQWPLTEERGLMRIYTPEQVEMFDQVRKYLGIQPGAIPRPREDEGE